MDNILYQQCMFFTRSAFSKKGNLVAYFDFNPSIFVAAIVGVVVVVVGGAF